MASPTVSTPSSMGSPAYIVPAIASAPPLAIKTNRSEVAVLSSLEDQRPTIVTRKEWVVPPRPKPGRKPATDTPPTKRKAQNRAAQRAFRERRAARVGELEEQLEETKDEQQKRENGMILKITKLEADVLRFSGEVQSWKLRCETLDRIVEFEKQEKEAALAELSYLRYGIQTTSTDAVPLPPRRPRTQHKSGVIEHLGLRDLDTKAKQRDYGSGLSTVYDGLIDEASTPLSGCGNCTVESQCQCLEAAIKDTTAGVVLSLDLKRSHPSLGIQAEKRQRRLTEPPTPLEVDFTEQFASKSTMDRDSHPSERTITPTAQRTTEACGFCEDGTYCMCSEAAETTHVNEGRGGANRLAPLLSEVTPPPSDSDVDGALAKLPYLQPSSIHQSVRPDAGDSCVNGPGTCQQCRSDPKSGLFCRSLAAIRNRSPSAAKDAGCCGGNGGGQCCKSLEPARPPPSLSVADTYKTLSTHQNFDQASDELDTWLGRLHAVAPQHVERAPMEVEAASVMNVLKHFDRRFGRG